MRPAKPKKPRGSRQAFSRTAPAATAAHTLPESHRYADSTFTKKDDLQLRGMFKELTSMISIYRERAENLQNELDALKRSPTTAKAPSSSQLQVKLLTMQLELRTRELKDVTARCDELRCQLSTLAATYDRDTAAMQASHEGLKQEILALVQRAQELVRDSERHDAAISHLSAENAALKNSLSERDATIAKLRRQLAAKQAASTPSAEPTHAAATTHRPTLFDETAAERAPAPEQPMDAVATIAAMATAKASRRKQPTCMQRFMQMLCCCCRQRRRHAAKSAYKNVDNLALYKPLRDGEDKDESAATPPHH